MKELTKTFSVTVKFRHSEYIRGTTEYKDISASDAHVVAMRAEIKERIEKACRLTKGVLNSQPGTVSET